MKKTASQRPLSITFLCLWSVVSLLLSILNLLSPIRRAHMMALHSGPHWLFISALDLTFLASLMGLWKMRKWGALLYTVITFVSIVNFLINSQSLLLLKILTVCVCLLFLGIVFAHRN